MAENYITRNENSMTLAIALYFVFICLSINSLFSSMFLVTYQSIQKNICKKCVVGFAIIVYSKDKKIDQLLEIM